MEKSSTSDSDKPAEASDSSPTNTNVLLSDHQSQSQSASEMGDTSSIQCDWSFAPSDGYPHPQDASYVCYPLPHNWSESTPYFPQQRIYVSRNVNYVQHSSVATRVNNYLSSVQNTDFPARNPVYFHWNQPAYPPAYPTAYPQNEGSHIHYDYSDGVYRGQNLAGNVSRGVEQTQGILPLPVPPNRPTNYRHDERVRNWNTWQNLAGNVSRGAEQTQGFFPLNRPTNYRRDERVRNDAGSNMGFRLDQRVCGPRSIINRSRSAAKTEDSCCIVRREEYNKSDFQTDYENAKFYVIKSYNEDDVHKSIKYRVWASTPKGNEKLDKAFHETEAKFIETNIQCPIFLFFSVNKSGQFVGIAEMKGPVDFNKDMDFWQEENWKGFFPVEWHIVKDVPHGELRHIRVDDNSDATDVTFTRDTREIGLKAGLEMLSIFKSYEATTSLLDDFSFYESGEKRLRERRKRRSKPQSSAEAEEGAYDYHSVTMHQNASESEADADGVDRCSNALEDLSLDHSSSSSS